ncbi:MAG TPA: TetR family transcriptional regulator [Gaiellaceae bacterium]|nr:TetR family transcriptional regulator [Gaiellaceae bacterium]
MGRWEPNARGRLAQAAIELYGERGFDRTTVAEIAARAGLTERTFFRHYSDKREVLFAGSEAMAERLVAAVAAAPGSAPPLATVAVALEEVGAAIQESRGRDFARARRSIIVSNPELQERELIKLASWAGTLAGALRDRGVDETTATLAAQTGVAVFHVAFGRWVSNDDELDLPALIRDSLTILSALTAAVDQSAAVA